MVTLSIVPLKKILIYLGALGLSCSTQDFFSCGVRTLSCGMWDLVP